MFPLKASLEENKKENYFVKKYRIEKKKGKEVH